MNKRHFRPGTIVQHFKRQYVRKPGSRYLYRILAYAQHTETRETLVIYQALYGDMKICARPYSMFYSKTDRAKYPDARQKWRFEAVSQPDWNN